MTTRRALLAGASLAVAAPAVARAETPRRWRMTTSWPKNLLGPGVSARRLGERIGAMSGGRLEIVLFAAGEIVPAFATLDAVASGAVEMAHTAAFFHRGKLPAADLFTTAPFGLGPAEHLAWIVGEGGALWDELYRPYEVRPFLAGNTGPSMGGWFRREVTGLDDLRGLRIRVQGLGSEVYARLGATPVAIPPGELELALAQGVVDAAELLAPANDLSLELHRHAKLYYAPGFDKPNGAGEAIVGRRAWEELPADLQAIVAAACAAEHAAGLADAERANGEALAILIGQRDVRIATFPADVLAAARRAAEAAIDALSARDALSGRIVASYREALARGRAWSSLQAYMQRALRSG